MVIPNTFRRSKEQVLKNYDYVDIASGTGVVLFYGFCETNSSATTYNLTTNVVQSSVIDFSLAGPATTDYNFDLTPFNKPQTIEGTAILTGSWGTGTGTSLSCTMTASIKKGTTSLASATAPTWTKGASAGTENFCLKITIPQTHFKVGEYLRLTLTTVVAASAKSSRIGSDPLNRDGTYINPSTDDPTTTTQLKLWIPFKIDA